MYKRQLLAGDFFTALQQGGKMAWVGPLLADQQAGGGITWGIGEIPMLILALLTGVAWMRACLLYTSRCV